MHISRSLEIRRRRVHPPISEGKQRRIAWTNEWRRTPRLRLLTMFEDRAERWLNLLAAAQNRDYRAWLLLGTKPRAPQEARELTSQGGKLNRYGRLLHRQCKRLVGLRTKPPRQSCGRMEKRFGLDPTLTLICRGSFRGKPDPMPASKTLEEMISDWRHEALTRNWEVFTAHMAEDADLTNILLAIQEAWDARERPK